MSGYSDPISDSEKVRIVSEFIKHAPPGEFNEVFNDVRVLLGNDTLLKEGASRAFVDYNNDQFTPTKVGNDMVLVTQYGADGSRYLDPKNKLSFKYDHLRKESSDPQPISVDDKTESFRAALDKFIQSYVKNHYPNGVVVVYGKMVRNSTQLTVCIEDHKFSPQNFWNGRWRSVWQVDCGSGDIKGTLRVQVHYYEDGNVQLVSSKEINQKIKIGGGPDDLAKAILKAIESLESEYQTAIGENYKTMSQTTFKALRRALPVTRTKIDWDKVLYQNVTAELKN